MNVAEASSVPLALHRLPMWVPVLRRGLVEADPGDDAAHARSVNLTPSSTALVSPESTIAGRREVEDRVLRA